MCAIMSCVLNRTKGGWQSERLLWWCLVVSEGWEQTDVSDGGEFPPTHTNWSTSNIFNKTDTLDNILHLNITRVELWWDSEENWGGFKPADCGVRAEVIRQSIYCGIMKPVPQRKTVSVAWLYNNKAWVACQSAYESVTVCCCHLQNGRHI